jgi:hypothetical protein
MPLILSRVDFLDFLLSFQDLLLQIILKAFDPELQLFVLCVEDSSLVPLILELLSMSDDLVIPV